MFIATIKKNHLNVDVGIIMWDIESEIHRWKLTMIYSMKITFFIARVTQIYLMLQGPM